MIWLLAQSISSKTEKEKQPDGRRGKGVGEKLNHTTARKLGPLYIIQYSLVL
jgi:hypothetical protein